MEADRTTFAREIARNRRATVILILAVVAVLYGLVWLAGAMLGFPPTLSLVAGTVITLVYVGVTWSFSVPAVLAATRARPADPNVRSEKLLVMRVEEMALAAGLPPPTVYVQDTPDINAFATGLTPRNSVVAVTTGALSRLDQEELQGVLAHEMSHILNRDVRVTTLTIAMVGAIAMIAEIFLRAMWYGGGGRSRGGGVPVPLVVAGLLLMILAPILSRLVYFALSRRREHLADATGVRLSRNPEGLARALEKIRESAAAKPVGSRTVAGLYLVNPWLRMGLSSAFSTHPPLDERIRRVRGMGARTP